MDQLNQALLELLPQLQIGAIFGGLVDTNRSWRKTGFTPAFCRFKYVLDGRCRVRVDQAEYLAEPGRLYFFPAGGVQAYGLAEGCAECRQYYVHFSATLAGLPLTELLELPVSVPVARAEEAAVIGLLDALRARDTASAAGQLRRNARLLELLAFYLERGECRVRPENAGLRRVLEHIDTHLAERLPLDELARLACLEPSYFSRKFKRVMGQPASAFILAKRLNHARRLLESGDRSFQEIAAQTGFCDAFQFSRMFKRQVGVSPSEYRKSQKRT